MKVAVLADIHGNLPALQTVVPHIEKWRPDAVIVAGDIVNRGPKPLECLKLIRDKQQNDGWLVVRGNHEDYVLSQTSPDAPRSGPAFNICKVTFWTLNHLDGYVPMIQAMPFQHSVETPDGGEIRTVHASMKSNRDGIYTDTPDDYLRRQISPPPRVFCTGHTHQPLIRTVDDTLVVNVGSAGMPYDGNPRAAYAQLTWQNGHINAEIVRLEYDREQTERDIHDTGFDSNSGPLAPLMIVEFRHSRAYLHIWMRRYQRRVMTGEVSIEKAIAEYISTLES